MEVTNKKFRVAVTGGSGFLGKEIVHQCEELGWEVIAIGRNLHPEMNTDLVFFVPYDIRKSAEGLADIFENVKIVFHTAAKADVWGKKDDFYSINVDGTQNVIEACRLAKVPHLIYTSTPSVVYSKENITDGDESLPYLTNCPAYYPTTKAIAEKIVLNANNKTLKTVALRPHLIWGLGDPHLIPRIIDAAAQRQLSIIGDGYNKVDITHVKNAAFAHICAAKTLLSGSNIPCGKAYFISQDKPIVLWKWINDLLSNLGVPTVSRYISEKGAYILGFCLELFWKIFAIAGTPPMTRFISTELSKDHWFNISAAKRDLNYKPIISTEEGLRELIKYYTSK